MPAFQDYCRYRPNWCRKIDFAAPDGRAGTTEWRHDPAKFRVALIATILWCVVFFLAFMIFFLIFVLYVCQKSNWALTFAKRAGNTSVGVR